MSPAAVCTASPSLALMKYWGKRNRRANTPATGSLAVSLGGLAATTRVTRRPGEASEDEVVVNGELQPPERYEAFFAGLRARLKLDWRFRASSANNFPASAGLASSSSGFAALALACVRLAEASGRPGRLSAESVSRLALVGSASAARAVFGGFTLLPAGSKGARRLFAADHWPELRIVVAVVAAGPKPISSREAMERSRLTSPYYRAWLLDSRRALPRALGALARRDLEELGEAARLSYLRMFSTMFSSRPPVIYWAPESVALIRACEEMRSRGVGVWETMDAGPQVKLLCLAGDERLVAERVASLGARCIVCPPAEEPACRVEAEEE